ncbi:MAG: hypothetical protein HY646_04625, partial [Acidobacteria bacterium]|nr:hypothetical protein [Acidobacteriota bacterium]
ANGSTGGQPSPSNVFFVGGGFKPATLPEIEDDDPEVLYPDGQASTVILTGTNVTGAADLRFLIPSPGGPIIDRNITAAISSVTATSITAQVTVSTTAIGGPRIVQIVAGTKRSLDAPGPNVIFVNNLGGAKTEPVLEHAEPGDAAPGQTLQMKLFGRNFPADPVVNILALTAAGPANDSAITSVVQAGNTSTGITINVSVGTTAVVGPRVIQVVSAASPTTVKSADFPTPGNNFFVRPGVITGPTINFVQLPQFFVNTTNNAFLINGNNFIGSTSANTTVQFKVINSDGSVGAVDSNVVYNYATLDAAGTHLAGTVNVGAGATIGRHLVVVTISGQSTSGTPSGGNILTIAPALIAQPFIRALSPNNLTPGSSVTLNLTGTNFTGMTGADVFQITPFGPIEDGDFTISDFTVVSSTSITFKITVGPDAAPGGRVISVKSASTRSPNVPNPGNSLAITAFVPGFQGGGTALPTITSLNKTQGRVGETISDFTITGDNLSTTNAILFFAPGGFGPPVPDPNITFSITSKTATTVVASVTILPGAFEGPHLIVVQTDSGPSAVIPDPSRIFSVIKSAVTGSVPVITSISPQGGSTGDVSITINGSNLTTDAAKIKLAFVVPQPGGPKADTGVSVKAGTLSVNSEGTQITVTITIAAAIIGPHVVVVSTPNGPSTDGFTPGNVFAVGSFSFGPTGPAFSPPVIDSVMPGTIDAGRSGVVVTIKGTSLPGAEGNVGFLRVTQTGPVPDQNISIQSISFDSATQIRVTINVDRSAATGPRAVVIGSPKGGSPNVPTPFNTIIINGGSSAGGGLPEIRSLNPNSDAGQTLGQAFPMTVYGNNLATVGANDMKFLIPTPAGPQNDTFVTAVVTAATTTSITASVTVASGATNGPRMLVVKNSSGRSLEALTPDNTFLVTLTSNIGSGPFNNFTEPPRVTSVTASRTSINRGDEGVTLTIVGKNIDKALDVLLLSGSPGGPIPDINIDVTGFSVTGTAASATITATIDVGSFAQNGQRAVVVMTPFGPSSNGFETNVNTITIGSSTGGEVKFENLPGIDYISPQSLVQGQTATLTITGQNLNGASGIQFVMPTPEGPARDDTITATITDINSTGTVVTATVKVGSASVSGPRAVVVRTPNGDAGNPPTPGSTVNVGFIQQFGGPPAAGGVTGAPAISSIAPKEHAADGVPFNLAITGTNLGQAGSMQFFLPTPQGPVPDPSITVGAVTVQTSTAINANVTIPATAAAGPRFVVVSTPAGPAGMPPTDINTFNVKGGVVVITTGTAAVITSIGPNTVPSGSVVTGFKIQGRNLQGTNQIRFFKFGSTTADTAFTFGTITVNATGTEVSTNLTVTNAADPGPRVVVLTATAGTTPNIPGSNVLNIVGNSNGPNITSVSPTSATPGESLRLTINGQFLCASFDCAVDPEVLFFALAGGAAPAQDNTFSSTIYSKTPTSLTVIVNVPATLAEPQFRLVVVKTSAGRSSDAPSPGNTINFGARTGQPVISSLTPDSIGITSTVSATTTVTITFSGSNLLGSAVSFFIPSDNGAQRDQSFFAKVTNSTASSITAEVTMPTRTVGSRRVIVTNANGDNFSQIPPVFLTITNGNAPTLTSISPTSKPAGGSAFTFSVVGTNLGAVTGMKFIVPGAAPYEDFKMGATSIVPGSTSVTAQVTIQSGALPGSRNVLLLVGTTPILTEPKAETTFFVVGGTDQTAPFLSGASPASLVAGLQKLSLQGNNLAGATVKLYNQPTSGNAPALDTSIIASVDFSSSSNSFLSVDLQIPASATGARIVVVETLSGNNLNQPPIVVNIVGSLVTTGTAPHVTNVTPNNGNPGSSVNVVVTGTNFTGLDRLFVFTQTPAGSQFEPGITVSSFAVSDSTHITATLTIGSSVQQVPRFLVVAKEGDPTKRSETSANPSNSFNVGTAGGSETGTIPTISSIGPSSHAADGVQFQLSITGMNLSTVNDIRFIAGGSPDPAFSVSGISFDSATNRLTANVTIASSATSGDHVIVARNSTTGLSTPFSVNADFSNVFRVGTQTPTGQANITSISPTFHAADGVTFSFTVNGSGFGQVAKAQFITLGEHPQQNFLIQVLSATVNSDGTQITGTMNIPTTSPTGLHHVVLYKADNTPAGFQGPAEGINTFTVGSTTVSSGALTLSKTNGDAQTGPANQAMAVPLEVLVTSGGNPAAGVGVSFAVASGAGFISPTFVQADSSGKARAYATLGASPTGSTQTFTASAGEGSNRQTVTFTATVGTEFTGPIPTEMFPNNAIVGAQNIQMTIRGKNFNSVTAVFMKLGGVNDHSITFTNFNNNQAGTITVTMNISSTAEAGDRVLALQTSDGSVYDSGALFKVNAATGTFVQEIRPNFGTVGQSNLNIEILGNNLSSVTGLRFMINNAPDTAIQVLSGSINTSVAGEVMATINIGTTAQVGLHRLVLVAGSTEIPTNVEFNVYPAGSPSITFLDPGGANVGQTITAFKINGSNLGGVTNVKFKFGSTIDTALAISNIVINTEKTLITATLTIGNNAQIGQHSVVLSGAPGDFDTGFPFFVFGTGISNVSPNNGTAGGSPISPFILRGNNLSGVTALKFLINGVNDTALSVSGLGVNSDGTQVTATSLTVGSAAQIGGHNIVLVKGTEEIATTAIFQVNPASGTATVTGFYPDNGSVGQQTIFLTITGSNFGDVTGIRFDSAGTQDTKLTVSNFQKNTDNTQITASLNIATDAPTGGRALVLVTASGVINSGRSFQVNAFTGGGGGTFQLSVTRVGTGTGTVVSISPPNLIDCGTQCSASTTSGITVTLRATTATGSTFAGWSGACTNTSGDCTVTMNESKTVTATFNTTGGGPAISVSSISPSATNVGQPIVLVEIKGSDLVGVSGLQFHVNNANDPGVTVKLMFSGPNEIFAALGIASNATVAAHKVVLQTGAGNIATNTDFQVNAAPQPAPVAYSVSHIAGSAAGAGSVDGTGASARFISPRDAWSDGTNIFVVDEGGTVRKVVISTGEVTTLAGRFEYFAAVDGTGSAARFHGPRAPWGDGQGNLYVGDTTTIRKVVISTGQVTTLAGKALAPGSTDGTGSEARFGNVSGLWGDGQGNLYAADGPNSTIRKVVISTGQVTTFAGTAGSSGYADGTGSAARFTQPTGIWGDVNNLYVTNNRTVRQISIAGATVTTLAGSSTATGATNGIGTAARFQNARKVVGDGQGNLYVTDSGADTIRKIVISTAEVTTFAGTAYKEGSTDGTGPAATFNNPRGIAIDSANLYITDDKNHSIRKVVISTREVSTLAGPVGISGSTDANGTNARFNGNRGIFGDSTNLYVTDERNRTIRKVALSTGDVTTLAGTAGIFGSANGTGSAAQFNTPEVVWSDGTNLYIGDGGNGIRKIVISTGVVTTVVTSAALAGGTGFSTPGGIFGDGQGNLYVGELNSRTIRRVVIATGEVTVLAGSSEVSGAADGTGSAAGFLDPSSIWSDGTNLFVGDSNSIRKVVISTGQVTTIAGTNGVAGVADGIGSAARFDEIAGIFGDGQGNLFIADNEIAIRKLVIATGEVTTIAFPTPGSQAGLWEPKQLWSDGTNIYFADSLNHAIRKLAPVTGTGGGGTGAPAISSITPVSATAPSFSFTTFTINGSGFTQFSTAGPKVVFLRSGSTSTDSRFEVSNIQLVSNTQITFTLNAGSTSFPIDAGTYRIEVRDSITIPTIRTQDTDVTGVNIFTVQAQGAGLTAATFSVEAGKVTAGVDVTVPAPAGTPVNIKAAGAFDVSATSYTVSASAVELTRGQTGKLVLSGTQIRPSAGSVLSISGVGIALSGIEFQTAGSDDLIIAQTQIAADAPTGPRYAMVKNTNDDISIFSGGLIISLPKLTFIAPIGQVPAGQTIPEVRAGQTIPEVKVAVTDASGKTFTSASNAITISLGSGSPAGATLSGTTTVNAVNGVATFNNLSINNIGNGYSLSVTASPLLAFLSGTELTPGTSNSFKVVQ